MFPSPLCEAFCECSFKSSSQLPIRVLHDPFGVGIWGYCHQLRRFPCHPTLHHHRTSRATLQEKFWRPEEAKLFFSTSRSHSRKEGTVAVLVDFFSFSYYSYASLITAALWLVTGRSRANVKRPMIVTIQWVPHSLSTEHSFA